MEKTVVIPYELFKRLKNNESQLNRSDDQSYESQLKEILQRDIPLEKKNFLYQQVLFNILRVDQEGKKDISLPLFDNTPVTPTSTPVQPSPLTPPPSAPPSTSQVQVQPTDGSEGITKLMKNILGVRAKKVGMDLYNLLKGSSKIRWDDNGMVYIDNKPIALSNIIDIVVDLTSYHKASREPPKGLRALVPYIISENIPLTLIKNKARLKLIQSPGGSHQTTHVPRLKLIRRKTRWIHY